MPASSQKTAAATHPTLLQSPDSSLQSGRPSFSASDHTCADRPSRSRSRSPRPPSSAERTLSRASSKPQPFCAVQRLPRLADTSGPTGPQNGRPWADPLGERIWRQKRADLVGVILRDYELQYTSLVRFSPVASAWTPHWENRDASTPFLWFFVRHPMAQPKGFIPANLEVQAGHVSDASLCMGCLGKEEVNKHISIYI